MWPSTLILKERKVSTEMAVLFVILFPNRNIAPFNLKLSMKIQHLTLPLFLPLSFLPCCLPSSMSGDFASHYAHYQSRSTPLFPLLIRQYSLRVRILFLFNFFDKLVHCSEYFYYQQITFIIKSQKHTVGLM